MQTFGNGEDQSTKNINFPSESAMCGNSRVRFLFSVCVSKGQNVISVNVFLTTVLS